MSATAHDPHGLTDPASRADPHPAYARLRERAPVYYCEPWQAWVVSRYDDALACFRDPRLSANRAGGYAATLPPAVREQLAPLLGNLSRWALLLDPPDHTRIRSLINRAFTPRVIEAQHATITTLCDELLDAAEAKLRAEGSFDLMTSYAYPLPVAVIGGILGLPREDGERIERWSAALAEFMGGATLDAGVVGRALAAVVELQAYFRGVFERRRAEPGADLLSELLAAHDHDSRLDEQELLSTCTLLIFGGHETTTNLIGNAVLTLLRHPEQLERLRADPEGLAAGAVEEVLRFEAPVQRMGRVCKEDIELRGQVMKAGDRMFIHMGAANLDPERFPEPERFDVARADAGKHLTFGFGAHFCVGAALGRMEGRIAVRRLLERFEGLALAVPPQPMQWLDNWTVRGLQALPLKR